MVLRFMVHMVTSSVHYFINPYRRSQSLCVVGPAVHNKGTPSPTHSIKVLVEVGLSKCAPSLCLVLQSTTYY